MTRFELHSSKVFGTLNQYNPKMVSDIMRFRKSFLSGWYQHLWIVWFWSKCYLFNEVSMGSCGQDFKTFVI